MVTTRKCPCISECSRDPYRSEELANKDCHLCGGRGELRIRTSYDPKPIPVRSCDWDAWIDDDPERGMGYGSNKQEAIENLMDRLEVS